VSADHRFAYAQARLQARYADLPREGEWRRLSAARSLSAWLEEARSGALQTWVKGFSGQSDSHDIERGLRAQFVEALEQVVAAVPKEWRAAVDWCRWLPLLGLFEHLRGGGALPQWADDDRLVAPLLGRGGGLDRSATHAAGIDPLLADQPVLEAWLAGWRGRWPRTGRSHRAALDALRRQVVQHARVFRDAAPGEAWTLRQRLRERLQLELHRTLLQPASAFVLLLLVALDLERLRRALVDRALFEAVAAGWGSNLSATSAGREGT
jgi:hypothetical protein